MASLSRLTISAKSRNVSRGMVCPREGLAFSTPPACTMLLTGGSQHEPLPPLSTAAASVLQDMSHMPSLTQPCSQTLCFKLTDSGTDTPVCQCSGACSCMWHFSGSRRVI